MRTQQEYYKILWCNESSENRVWRGHLLMPLESDKCSCRTWSEERLEVCCLQRKGRVRWLDHDCGLPIDHRMTEHLSQGCVQMKWKCIYKKLGKLYQIEVSILPRLNTNHNPEGKDLPTGLTGSRQRRDQSMDLLTLWLTLLAWCPQAGTPPHLELSALWWELYEGCGEQMGQRATEHRSWCFLMKDQAPGCNDDFTSVTLDPMGFIYLSYPPFLLSTHQSTTSGDLCSPAMEELPMNAYYCYHNMFRKPSVFKWCMCCHEFQTDGGHLSNKDGVLGCSLCHRDGDEKSVSPCYAIYPHRGGDILRALTFGRNSEGRS